MFMQRATHPAYQAEHIKQVLRGDIRRLPNGLEQTRVQETIGRLTALIERGRLRREFAGLERYMDRMPRILYLYSKGYSVSDITDRLTGLPTMYGVERTIDIAATLAAEELNR
jgi:hypothetical protein